MPEQSAKETVLEQFEAVNRRDWARAMELYDDDVVLVVESTTSINPGTHEGKEAVGEWFGDWFRTFSEIHFDILRTETQGNRLAMSARHTATGKGSGIELANDLYYAYEVQNGKVIRVEFVPNWDDALRAAGFD